MLQEGGEVLLETITKILRASIVLKHIPAPWRGTTVDFITKAGRNGHTKAKDFRPISLTSFLLKTLKRLVDRYLKKTVLKLHLLAPSQYDYVENKSTDIALHHLVGGAERRYVVRVFLDIESASDSTSMEHMKTALISR